ncbi:dermonecrotic toxin domain-containing protein [Serratia sp. M24T3]|uniref:dermonecrotic toxin domain-containing protein n=1 Tax=Serratia sp. M24T3 TaxID=932213 RepID=UPI00025BB405|nr:DUF6543 domain-containing protein [Serratia sp. M24T3]EIC85727.1 hypothetical protein SPM24T3_05291 [Serratia sp. M24T3]
MLTAVWLEEINTSIGEIEKKNTGFINFPENNISNSKKIITSDKKSINSSNNWRLATQYERIVPGQGLLPQESNLAPVPSAKGEAIIAAVQLFGQAGTNCVDNGVNSIYSPQEMGTGMSFLAQTYNQGQTLLGQFDSAVDFVIQQTLPWSEVFARPLIGIEPDDEPSTVDQPGNAKLLENILDSEQKAAQMLNREAYLKVVNKVKDNYPQLYEHASDYLRAVISKTPRYYSMNINPDDTWFNRFESSESSSQSYTGWEHNSYPKESNTLTQVLLKNFGAEDRINSDALSGNSGIYTQGAEANFFGVKNEVKILPKDFLDIVVKSNFSDRFLRSLKDFWKVYGSNFRTMSKGKFISLMSSKSSNLSESGIRSVIMAALGDISQISNMSMDELEKKFSNREGLRISTFSIYGYHATDIILIHGFDGKIILYKPTETESFVEFNNAQELNNWVLNQVRDKDKKTHLEQHFSLYDRQDGHTYAGVGTALEGIASGEWDESYINYESVDIKGDLFSWLASQAEKRTLMDTNTLTVTNDEVFREQVLMNLQPIIVAAGLVSMVLPGVGSLILLEAATVKMEVGAYIAIYGDTEAKRRKGLVAAIDGGINALFGALGVSESIDTGPNEIIDEPLYTKTARDGPSQNVVSPPRGTFWDRLFNRACVNGRGIVEITRYNQVNGKRLVNSLIKMQETLVKAKEVLVTDRGREIVSAYLGIENSANLIGEDILSVQENIESLMTVYQEINNQKIPLKSVTMYNPDKQRTVGAFYNFHDRDLSFTDSFFTFSDERRLQILLHESMHATEPYRVGRMKDHMWDYFYVSKTSPAFGIYEMRSQTMRISFGASGPDFQREYNAEQVMEKFIKKMESRNDVEAILKFNNNEVLRKGVLLENPDTQSMLIMELGNQIPGAKITDGPFELPQSVIEFKEIRAKQLKEEQEDAKWGPPRRASSDKQVSGPR